MSETRLSKWTRDQAIRAAARLGVTHAEIARRHGISRQRVSVIVATPADYPRAFDDRRINRPRKLHPDFGKAVYDDQGHAE